MNKACPVVLRYENTELLAFQHPLAGCQIVKGTIEPGESIGTACARELLEESGISAQSGRYLGKWEAGFENQVWGFCQMTCSSELPDAWEHDCADGGGLRFKFFWLALESSLDDRWHPLFRNAIYYIRQVLSEPRRT